MRLQQPWVEGEAYEVALITSSGGTIAHEIAAAVETPATDLSFFGLMALLGIYVGVIPIALGHALAAVDPAHPARLAARRDGAHGRAARVPRDRRDARGLRARRRGLAGVRRRGARARRRGGRVPGADRRLELARPAPPRGARRGRVRRPSRAARRGRHRPAQPRRGRRDRLGLLRRRAGARRVPGRRLRAAQHDRGAGDRRADRAPAPDARRGSRCSA